MSQENVEVVRRAFEGFNREGLAAFDYAVGEIFDPEVEMRALGRLPDTKQALRGHAAALRECFAGPLDTFDIRLEADEFIDAGSCMNGFRTRADALEAGGLRG